MRANILRTLYSLLVINDDTDICYNVAIPWEHRPSCGFLLQHLLSSVMAYVKVEDRLPSCTVFCNVRLEWVERLRLRWVESLSLSKKERSLTMVDHYELLSVVLDDLQSELGVQERVQQIVV